MKALVTSSGQFGPFSSIETLSDRYRCDGVDYQFSVVGVTTIEDYVASPPEPVTPVVPQSVTMRQARLALHTAGLLASVEAAIAAAGVEAGIEWEYAQTVDRAAGLVPTMATTLGMTNKQLDDLFILAASL